MDLRPTIRALEDIGSGARPLDDEMRRDLCDAVAELVRVLAHAPGRHDPDQIGVWSNHERLPALARVADSVCRDHSATGQLARDQAEEIAAARALIDAFKI